MKEKDLTRILELSGLTEEKWMQKVTKSMKKKGTEGALHRQLGYKEDEKIPKQVLRRIIKAEIGDRITVKTKGFTVTEKLKKRAVFAMRGYQ